MHPAPKQIQVSIGFSPILSFMQFPCISFHVHLLSERYSSHNHIQAQLYTHMHSYLLMENGQSNIKCDNNHELTRYLVVKYYNFLFMCYMVYKIPTDLENSKINLWYENCIVM